MRARGERQTEKGGGGGGARESWQINVNSNCFYLRVLV